MIALPTAVVFEAVLLPVAVPISPTFVALSPLTKPETVSVKIGLAAP